MQTQDLIALRRQIHQHAEPGFLEYRTAALVINTLVQLGIPHQKGGQAMAPLDFPPTLGEQEHWADLAVAGGVDEQLVAYFREHGTAVIAVIKGNRPGPVWGLRVDMDALPIIEDSSPEHYPAKSGFGSETTYMHACGHDSHTAIGLGLASRLADRDFPGEVRILFQPAEEGVRGALPMIRAGAVDGIERMLAVHLGLDLPTGTIIGGAEDALATTKWTANFTGEAAHAAAAPEKGRNALAAAAHATLGILGLPRFASADTRVNVGTFHAEGSANIIPAAATITYETRASTNEALDELNRRAEAIIAGSATMHGVEVSTHIYGASANSVPDEDRLAELAAVAAEIPSVRNFISRGSMPGSDDAHLMIREVQKNGGTGTYIMVGAANPAPHHNPRFDIDEEAMGIALDLLESLFRSCEGEETARPALAGASRTSPATASEPEHS